MTNIIRVLSAAGLSFCSLLILSSTTKAQDSGPQLEVVPATHHDVSPPLREIEQRMEQKGFRIKPVGPIPHEPNVSVEDPVVQTTVGPLVGTTAGLNFPGVGNGDYGFAPNAAPPDTNGAAGAAQSASLKGQSIKFRRHTRFIAGMPARCRA